MMDVLISQRHFISGKMSQAIYNFPPEIETSPLPKSLDEKLTISIWQVGQSSVLIREILQAPH